MNRGVCGVSGFSKSGFSKRSVDCWESPNLRREFPRSD